MQTCQTGISKPSLQCFLDGCATFVLYSTMDCHLTEEQIQYFKANRFEINFKKGENILKQGTKATSILCVKSGLLKMYREQGLVYNTVSLKKKGDIVGLQSLFTKSNYLYSVEALTEAKACFIDILVFEKLFKENSDFAKEMVQYINNDMINMFDKLYSFTIKHIHGRLAEFLLYLQSQIYKTNPFELTISKTDISEILGTSKESISRLFKEFKNDGIITEKKHYLKINDFARLKLISKAG